MPLAHGAENPLQRGKTGERGRVLRGGARKSKGGLDVLGGTRKRRGSCSLNLLADDTF